MALITYVPSCAAISPDCTLTVRLEDKEKKPIDGFEVFICKIAELSGTDHYPAEGFEDSGISIAGIVNDPSPANAKKLFDYVQKNSISSLSAVSVSGNAEFASLDTGIWLVYCKNDGAYSFNPYIVFLPYAVEDRLYYEVSSAPKTEDNTPNNRSIYVVKKWEDKNNAAMARPESIAVDLILDGEIIDAVTLSEGNGWSYTFTELPDEGKYSVEEKAVKGYSVKYNGDSENGFIITNTYDGEKLPQTGQLWRPIAILSVAGVAFVLLGIVQLMGKKNEKKTK